MANTYAIRGLRTAASLKLAQLATRARALLSYPRSSDRGLIEARDGEPRARRPSRSIRGLRTAASLKHFASGAAGALDDTIRGLRTAASLKRGDLKVQSIHLDPIRGLRTAASLKRGGAGDVDPPAPRPIRGLRTAASLKLVLSQLQLLRRGPIRGLRTAASLKPRASQANGAVREGIYPRSSDRGLIEAAHDRDGRPGCRDLSAVFGPRPH